MHSVQTEARQTPRGRSDTPSSADGRSRFSRLRRTVAALGLGTTFAIAGPSVAWAILDHFLPSNSVDTSTSPPEIRYEDLTQWDTARNYSIGAWNNLPGGVNVAADNSSTVTDLQFMDYSSSTDGKCGKMRWNLAADNVWFNNYYYNNAGSSQRNACATHELGHAHGIADHDESTYNGAVMDSCPVCYSSSGDPMPQTPQQHDQVDYDGKW